MTWAFVGPQGFGKFWPEGEYDPWKKRATVEFSSLSQEEKNKYGDGQWPDFYKMSLKYRQPSEWLDEFECPDEFRLLKNQKDLAPIINTANRLYLVNAQLRDIIESFEQKKHQFWPVRLSLPKGGEYPEQYFAMVVHTYLDAFRPDLTDPECYRELAGGFAAHRDNKACYAKLTFSQEAIGDKHFWRDRRFLLYPEFFMSDELKAAIDDVGLSLPRHFRVATQ